MGGANSFREALEVGVEVYHTLRGVVRDQLGQDACNVTEGGGFAPRVDDQQASERIAEAVQRAGHQAKVRTLSNPMGGAHAPEETSQQGARRLQMQHLASVSEALALAGE